MGNLFYVIGASGVGKDSVMNYARSTINGSFPVIFAHRYITRPAKEGNENHVQISRKEFHARQQGGLFALHWDSHDQHYGIGVEINSWLEKGFHVVVNGSRGYLPEAQKKYPQLKVVLIEADPETIRQRLESRGRENSVQIQKRIDRNGTITPEWENTGMTFRIQNDGLLEEAGDQLISLIRHGSQ